MEQNSLRREFTQKMNEWGGLFFQTKKTEVETATASSWTCSLIMISIDAQ